MKNTLALDLGTRTGWAVWDEGTVHSGTWLLATERELRQQRKTRGERRCDMRFVSLSEHIRDAVNQYSVESIVFEDVLFLSSQAQSQLWSSLRAAVWASGLAHGCVHTGVLKKYATGKGNADKAQMMAALAALSHPWGRVAQDDNEADALWVLRWFYEEAGTKTARANGVPATAVAGQIKSD